MSIEAYVIPRTVKEARGLLTRGKGTAAVIAGGFSLAPNPPSRIKTLVDITALGLDYVRVSKSAIRIGAACTVAGLLEAAPAGIAGRLLVQAARDIGGTPNRNVITVGGNIVQLLPWADLPVALLVLDAKIKIAGARGARLVRAEEFFRSPPLRQLRRGEFVTEIVVGKTGALKAAAFEKIGPSANSYCFADCAVALLRRGNSWEARAALSGATALPARLGALEKALKGLTPARMPAAAAAALPGVIKSLKIRPDIRADAEWRRELAGEIVKTALAAAVGRVSGKKKK